MDLLEILKHPEGKTLEFKRELSAPEGALRTIVAFANTAGGILLLGVEDRTRHVRGIREPLDLKERLANLISDSIVPRLVPEIEILPWRRTQVVTRPGASESGPPAPHQTGRPRRYIVFHHKTHPSQMGAQEISAFLTSLAVRERVSASTQNQALSALLLGLALGRSGIGDGWQRRRRGRRRVGGRGSLARPAVRANSQGALARRGYRSYRGSAASWRRRGRGAAEY